MAIRQLKMTSRTMLGPQARPIALAGLALMLTGAPGCGDEGARQSRSGSAGGVPATADANCLRFLREHRVPFTLAPPTRGIVTPIEVTGSFAGIRLTPRGRRAPVMDCELGRALVEAAPVFRGVGLTELSFSGAYDYRNRRGSSQLSAHAAGLAIDVHELTGRRGTVNVAKDFERGVGRWRGLNPTEGDMDGCVGSPRTSDGRRLRHLVCRLKHHSAFRVVITPDDDRDHRDHLHLEAFPTPEARVSRLMRTVY
jgi:hypothetical protein